MVQSATNTIEATKEHNEDDEDYEDNENKKGFVDYQKFSFSYYIISDVDFYGKRRIKRKKVEFIPEKQVSILLKAVTRIVKNKGSVVTITKDKNNLKKLYKPLNGKKKSVEYEEDGANDNESDESHHNTRKYDVMGYDKKTKRMSIIEILKKRKISIKSEEPFKNQTFLDTVKEKEREKQLEREKEIRNKNLAKSNAEKEKEKNEEKKVEDTPEIQETDDGVKYLIFTCSVTITRENKCKPKDFKPSHEASVTLKGYVQLMMEEEEREREKEREKAKINKKPKILKNKNNLFTLHNKKLNKNKEKANLNNSAIITKKRLLGKNNKGANLDKSADNKQIIRSRKGFGDTIHKNKNKLDKSQGIKPPLFSKYSSGEEEGEEEEEEEEKEEEEYEDDDNTRGEHKKRKPNKYDELLHAFALANYNSETKKVTFSDNIKSKDKRDRDRYADKDKDKDDIETRERSGSRNAVMNNKITSKDIYTDKATNESRRSFKKRLTHNEYKNEEEEEVNPKNVHKVKSNKAKIRKFKSKHDSEAEIPIIQPKKVTAYNLKENQKKIKMKKFQNKEKNVTAEYGYNNVISQDSTYNQNSDGFYPNDIKKNAVKAYANQRSNSIKKRNYLSHRSNTNDSTNRDNKSDRIGTKIRLVKSKNKNVQKH